ncbi:ankyrin repeat-containing domain protein [Myxozyma melibiosi]|uniref:Ankyrin repeat-containing domain protein n=1 Tax=Myxozyma melibiosi TaxID=54550 RepID=A0ABR1F873_9ASCO
MAANLWLAASDNDIRAVEALLVTGTNTANDKDPHGYTALHAAASYGHHDLLRLLVKRGGDVNILDEDGETPLFVVEKVETAKVLIEELGADWKVKNDEGVTAREKLQKDVEEDGEPFEEVVGYLKGLEDGTEAGDEGIESMQRRIADAIPSGSGMSVSIQRESVRRLVEEAVRLQLGDGRTEEERSVRRKV